MTLNVTDSTLGCLSVLRNYLGKLFLSFLCISLNDQIGKSNAVTANEQWIDETGNKIGFFEQIVCRVW